MMTERGNDSKTGPTNVSYEGQDRPICPPKPLVDASTAINVSESKLESRRKISQARFKTTIFGKCRIA